MFEDVRLKLAGVKTYLVGLSSIIGTLVAFAEQAISSGDAIQLIITAVLGMTIRGGIAGLAKK